MEGFGKHGLLILNILLTGIWFQITPVAPFTNMV